MAQDTYQERDQAQSADIARSWVDCRMLRFPFPVGGDWDYRVLMLDGQRVIADLMVAERPDGLFVNPTSPFTSLVNERVTEHGDNGYRKLGWLPAKRVRFNTISLELVMLPPGKRGSKDDE